LRAGAGDIRGYNLSVFLSLFFNIVPLYVIIAIGYLSTRFLSVDKNSLANLAIYVFIPVVVFGFMVNLDLKLEYVSLPLFFYVASVVLGFLFLRIGQIVYGDKQANLLAMCTCMGNTGYFGLPLVLLFFNNGLVAIYMFMVMAGILFEATYGYYIAARSSFTMRQSLIKLLKFPSLYAMILGLIFNIAHFDFPEIFWTYWTYFKGAYVIVGMMIIGASLAGLKRFTFGGRFVGLVFFGKFICFPSLALAFIYMDKMFFHWLSADIYSLLVMGTIVPPAANIAAFASQLDIEPEKAATTILLGTVFALFYIPVVIMVMGI